MSTCFSDRLDATLARLKAAGLQVVEIRVDPAALEQIFLERGLGAIILDCDPNRDVGWYGEVEVRAGSGPDASIHYLRDGEAHAVGLDEDIPIPLAAEARDAAPASPDDAADRAAA